MASGMPVPDYAAIVRCATESDAERAQMMVRDGRVELLPREQGRGLYGVVFPEQLAALVVTMDDMLVWTCACGNTGRVPGRPCVHVVAVVRAWLSEEVTGVGRRRARAGEGG